jgi:ATP-dependent helicase/nuclease subunit A
MTPAVAEMIDVDAVLTFFEGALGAAVLDSDNTVWREWPFTIGVPVAEVHSASGRAGDSGDDIVVVQGIIDLLVRTSEGLLIIDLKSDRVSGREVEQRAAAYRGQLNLYAKAAARILSAPVRRQWLYFLAPRRAVQL